MGKYLKFLAVHGFVLATTLGIALGAAWMWLGIGVIYGVMIAGDEWIGDDYAEPAYAHPRLLDALLYLALPTLAVLCGVMAWMAASGDPFGLGAWVQAQFGYDLFAARAATAPWHWLGGILSAALTFAAVGTNVGHELTHRTADRGAMIAGRWLLALTFDAEFAIEHVYGHHRRLATPADPATARRGEHFYAFLLRSIAGQTRSAFELERDRLTKLDLRTWSWHNRYLRGWLMSGFLVLSFGLVAGTAGVVVFVLAGLAGRTVLEAVNYFEHYGLVREPASPIEPRHSWNSNKALSNVVLFNLARHSHHHAEGDAPFWRLRSYPEAPTLPYGYLTCMLLVYVAPGWYRDRMTPLVLDWDRRYASVTERVLAAVANRTSGLAALQAAQAAA